VVRIGKLKELMNEYKRAPIGSPAEKEAREGIEKIVEWMKENGILTKEFKLPTKQHSKSKRMFGYYPDEGWIHMGNFIVHESDKEAIDLLTKYNKEN
jgi:hypothetical protein